MGKPRSSSSKESYDWLYVVRETSTRVPLEIRNLPFNVKSHTMYLAYHKEKAMCTMVLFLFNCLYLYFTMIVKIFPSRIAYSLTREWAANLKFIDKHIKSIFNGCHDVSLTHYIFYNISKQSFSQMFLKICCSFRAYKKHSFWNWSTSLPQFFRHQQRYIFPTKAGKVATQEGKVTGDKVKVSGAASWYVGCNCIHSGWLWLSEALKHLYLDLSSGLQGF